MNKASSPPILFGLGREYHARALAGDDPALWARARMWRDAEAAAEVVRDAAEKARHDAFRRCLVARLTAQADAKAALAEVEAERLEARRAKRNADQVARRKAEAGIDRRHERLPRIPRSRRDEPGDLGELLAADVRSAYLTPVNVPLVCLACGRRYGTIDIGGMKFRAPRVPALGPFYSIERRCLGGGFEDEADLMHALRGRRTARRNLSQRDRDPGEW